LSPLPEGLEGNIIVFSVTGFETSCRLWPIAAFASQSHFYNVNFVIAGIVWLKPTNPEFPFRTPVVPKPQRVEYPFERADKLPEFCGNPATAMFQNGEFKLSGATNTP
jgi:hypothetical protein